MNILYVSHLLDHMFAGPNHSVPAQISSQAKYDNVFWWNLTDAVQEDWNKLSYFHTQKDYPERKIKNLPVPFNRPDLVIFEAFYYIDDYRLSRECIRRGIPYIIVPRSALTYQGQKQKKMKKLIANMFMFRKMTRNACAIQYLTEKEKKDSGDKWAKADIIIPNGINERKYTKQYSENFGQDLVGVSIGRVATYQKGLDLLIEACDKIRNDLLQAKMSIHIYGPDFKGDKQLLIEEVEKRKLEKIIKFHDGIVGIEKEEVLNKADFFIMTSRFEGMPMALIEAMSFGLPVFVTTGTNMAQEVKKVDSGWTSNVTADSIAQSLNLLIEQKADMQRKSYNSWMLSKDYNWDTIAKISHSYYKNIVEQ